MSNFEKWKAAKAAFDATEGIYNSAHNALIDAGWKRARAWDALAAAANKLTGAEKMMAADFEYGPRDPVKGASTP
jgi:hypothetical protein